MTQQLSLRDLTTALIAGETGPRLYADLFAALMDGACTPAQTGAILALTAQRLGDSDLIAAGARAMRSRVLAVSAPEDAIDVCGTGGDGAETLNVSTAVSFVLAGAGVTVAKHGNRAMSSKSGAADVLEALGVRLTGDVAILARVLQDARVAFLFAQNHHPAMRHVAGPRRELGVRTVFNLLGPLSNPAGVRRQLVGAFSAAAVRPMADALAMLGARAAWVVHGHGGLDEVALDGPTHAAIVSPDGVRDHVIDPAAFGVDRPVPSAAIRGGDAAFNAAALRTLLEGRDRDGAYRAYVEVNAAAALLATGLADDPREARARVAASLDGGAALAALDRLVQLTAAAP